MNSIPYTCFGILKRLPHGPRSGGAQPNMVLLMTVDVFLEQIPQYRIHSQQFEGAH
jgi:hypothetical protein